MQAETGNGVAICLHLATLNPIWPNSASFILCIPLPSPRRMSQLNLPFQEPPTDEAFISSASLNQQTNKPPPPPPPLETSSNKLA
ncbi:hypothetical protein Pmani_022401 [Petrolisthes manimaculis]|uniref:Uncharacterized protein n=1 Tax=Petrolisthes manimaculis TaxID=1843537 RepID=A0AAE1PE35_9EUCA|nr:hypothetical protein Pmani_022401 [Petrolisthes manimaculis]